MSNPPRSPGPVSAGRRTQRPHPIQDIANPRCSWPTRPALRCAGGGAGMGCSAAKLP